MKTEIKKALCNKYFICTCAYGVIISILHSYKGISKYNIIKTEVMKYSTIDTKYNPLAEISTAFTVWIGFDTTNILAKTFFYIFPLMAALPYCWSYCSDRKSGYFDKAIDRLGKYNYHLNKYIAVFISSGLTVVLPLVLNFMIILLFVPAISPDSVYDIYYGIFSGNFMADIFYNLPFLYVVLFILLNFVFCGLLSCFGYSVSTMIKSKIIAILFPSIVLGLIEFLNKKFVEKYPMHNIGFSPLSFLCPSKSVTANWLVITTEILVLFLSTFYLSVYRFRNKGKNKRMET